MNIISRSTIPYILNLQKVSSIPTQSSTIHPVHHFQLFRRNYRFFSSNKPKVPDSSPTPSLSSSSSPSSSVWTIYSNSVKQYPLTVKCLTSGTLSVLADITCQYAFPYPTKIKDLKEHESNDNKISVNYDYWRTIKFTVVGTFFTAPSLHYWYGFLATTINGFGVLPTFIRLSLDQLLFAPAFIASFFMILSALDGKTLPEIHDKLRADLYDTIVCNFSVWVPAQFINFTFVPPHLQVLYANVIGFFWNIYLSYASNKMEVSSSSVVKTDVK